MCRIGDGVTVKVDVSAMLEGGSDEVEDAAEGETLLLLPSTVLTALPLLARGVRMRFLTLRYPFLSSPKACRLGLGDLWGCAAIDEKN